MKLIGIKRNKTRTMANDNLDLDLIRGTLMLLTCAYIGPHYRAVWHYRQLLKETSHNIMIKPNIVPLWREHET